LSAETSRKIAFTDFDLCAPTFLILKGKTIFLRGVCRFTARWRGGANWIFSGISAKIVSNVVVKPHRRRRAEFRTQNSLAKMGETAWAALCVAHPAVGLKPTSSILVSLLHQARTYFQNL